MICLAHKNPDRPGLTQTPTTPGTVRACPSSRRRFVMESTELLKAIVGLIVGGVGTYFGLYWKI